MCAQWRINTPLHKVYLQLVYYIFGVKVFVAYELVVSRGVVLGVVIPKVGCYWSPKIFESPLGAYILYPIEAHFDGLGLIMIQGFVEKTLDVELSTCIFVGGCWYPISIRVVHSGTSYCESMKDTPISTSNVNSMTFVLLIVPQEH